MATVAITIAACVGLLVALFALDIARRVIRVRGEIAQAQASLSFGQLNDRYRRRDILGQHGKDAPVNRKARRAMRKLEIRGAKRRARMERQTMASSLRSK